MCEWLDKIKARECVEGLAFFKFQYTMF